MCLSQCYRRFDSLDAAWDGEGANGDTTLSAIYTFCSGLATSVLSVLCCGGRESKDQVKKGR